MTLTIHRNARWLSLLFFLLATVIVNGGIAVAGDQRTEQGPQAEFTVAVYSYAEKVIYSNGDTSYVAPDR